MPTADSPPWPLLLGAELRAAINAVLPVDADLVAFCHDYFPDVSHDFASEQTRTYRDNLLIAKISPDQIIAKLGERDSAQLRRWLRRNDPDTRALLATAPLSYTTIERKVLAESVWKLLLKERRLLLLAPERGGARTLARQVAAASGLKETAITWLAPATAAATIRSYFASLTGNPRVSGAADYQDWQRHRARGQRRHLIVLMHDGGDENGLRKLAATLRGLLHETDSPFHVLAAGSARAARLRFEVDQLSLFSGVRVERVPELQPGEVAAITGLPKEAAAALQHATGGHPGFLRIVAEGGPLPLQTAALETEVTARLAQSERLSGLMVYRLRQDDRDRRRQRHAGLVLDALLNQAPVRRLDEPGVADFFIWGEVRLYYDGLVRPHATSQATELRCEAVRQLATLCVRNWREAQV